MMRLPRLTMSAREQAELRAERALPTELAGVIDLGSNSVRLVVYRIDGRALTPMLNEKVTAALGRDLPRTGGLSDEGKEAAHSAVKRFAAVLRAQGVTQIHAVATAAVRDAADGADFARALERDAGVRLRVLSGAEEAQYSARGVTAGIPEARGVVGDLGGSSLELVAVAPGFIGPGESFRLGHLSLNGAEPFSYERVAQAADAALGDARDPALRSGGALYAVGGAWRALGRIDMALNNHPLRVLHHHEMSRAEVLKITDFVRRQSKRSLERLEEAAAKRAESLPFAAVVLERLMHWGGYERLIISSSGLREGVLLSALPESDPAIHPLIAAAEAFAGPWRLARAFGRALEHWIAPAFEGVAATLPGARDPLLRAAASRLADFGSALHPDQREEIMFDLVLRAPLTGLTHTERAFLAASAHHRHTKAAPSGAAYARLLNEEQRSAAAAAGAALRLGADVSARSSELLARFSLARAAGAIELGCTRADAHLVSETVQRRLDALASALSLTPKISVR